MANNYVLLERIELNASAASVTFSNIPQTGYTDLKVVASLRGTGSENWGNVTFNGGGTAISMRHLLNNNGSVLSQAYSPLRFECTPSSYTANTFANAEMYIPNYASTTVQKSVSMDGVQENNSTTNTQHLAAGLWANTAAITSITITPDGGGTFAIGSSASLYGLAAVGTTPAIAPKADGGNVIATDGTYWYHAFLANGTFTPQVNLTCDYLVVAGGGGGGREPGGNNQPSGGGAGGMRSTVTATGGGGSLESALGLTTQNYAVTIGAGGTAGTSQPTNGVNSTFSSITSIGGGSAGSVNTAGNGWVAAGSGGSGGGMDAAGVGAAGAGTANQGYAGGTNPGSNTYGAGGGGAGGVGGNSSGSGIVSGGAGVATVIGGTSVTYARGGNGGNSGGTAGTANTGNGGYGGGSSGGNGGSGIIIIRYLVA